MVSFNVFARKIHFMKFQGPPISKVPLSWLFYSVYRWYLEMLAKSYTFKESDCHCRFFCCIHSFVDFTKVTISKQFLDLQFRAWNYVLLQRATGSFSQVSDKLFQQTLSKNEYYDEKMFIYDTVIQAIVRISLKYACIHGHSQFNRS